MVKYACERCRIAFETIEQAQACEKHHLENDSGLAPVNYIGQVCKSIDNPNFRYVTVGKVPRYIHGTKYEIPLWMHVDVETDGTKRFFFYEQSDAVVTSEDDVEQQLIAVRRSIYAIEYLLEFIKLNSLLYTKELLDNECQDIYKVKKYGSN